MDSLPADAGPGWEGWETALLVPVPAPSRLSAGTERGLMTPPATGCLRM